MELKMTRIELLNSILEYYKGTSQYETLLQLLKNGESIDSLLKSEAIVYTFLMSSSNLTWKNNKASYEYGDSLERYQVGYQLYVDYAYYFLGANVIYPCLDCIPDDYLKDYSLIDSGRINYSSFLENVEMKLA